MGETTPLLPSPEEVGDRGGDNQSGQGGRDLRPGFSRELVPGECHPGESGEGESCNPDCQGKDQVGKDVRPAVVGLAWTSIPDFGDEDGDRGDNRDHRHQGDHRGHVVSSPRSTAMPAPESTKRHPD